MVVEDTLGQLPGAFNIQPMTLHYPTTAYLSTQNLPKKALNPMFKANIKHFLPTMGTCKKAQLRMKSIIGTAKDI